MTTNYFKVRGDRVRIVWFNDGNRLSARWAFGVASATPGVLSVYARPAISGEWDGVPPIVEREAEFERLALDGEGGVW